MYRFGFAIGLCLLVLTSALRVHAKQVKLSKALSEKSAMDALFEVAGEGQDARYIWKNIDAPPDAAKNRSTPITDGNNGEVWALGFKELAPARAILVVGLTELDERGERDDCHACSERASTFFFNRDENKDWVLTNVELDVARFGSHGGTGDFSFIELGPRRFGFLFDSGGTWQGYTATFIDVFEISKDNKTIRRTKNPIRVYADHTCDESDRPENCFSVEGKWRFVPGPVAGIFDLVIDFNGTRARRKIQQRARYRLKRGFFELIGGSNPVPEV